MPGDRQKRSDASEGQLSHRHGAIRYFELSRSDRRVHCDYRPAHKAAGGHQNSPPLFTKHPKQCAAISEHHGHDRARAELYFIGDRAVRHHQERLIMVCCDFPERTALFPPWSCSPRPYLASPLLYPYTLYTPYPVPYMCAAVQASGPGQMGRRPRSTPSLRSGPPASGSASTAPRRSWQSWRSSRSAPACSMTRQPR